jgi:hypothetical protein
MPGPPQPIDCFVQQRRAMTASLSPLDHKKGPEVTLMVCAGETLNPRIVLGNKENRLVEIPLDLRRRHQRRILKAIFSSSLPHLMDARQVELGGRAQARKHVAIWFAPPAIAIAIGAPPQAAPWVSKAASAIASRGPRSAHKTNWNAW